MISQTAVVTKAEALGSSIPDQANDRRLGLISILVLSAWCGLIAGLLEVGTIVLRKQRARSGSSLQDEPALRLADPSFERLRLSDAGTAWVWHRAGLAASRSLAGQALLVRTCALTLRSGCFSPDLWPGLAGCDAGGGHAACSAHRTPWSRFPAIRPLQLPGGRRDRGDPGGIALGGRPIPASARVRGPCRRRVHRMSC